MDIAFDANMPIYHQLVKNFTGRIASGEWQPGEKMLSVRELAVQYEVNPNTIQRALAELERNGLCHSERTSGRYVTKDKKRIIKARDDLAQDERMHYFEQMKRLGYNEDDARRFLIKP